VKFRHFRTFKKIERNMAFAAAASAGAILSLPLARTANQQAQENQDGACSGLATASGGAKAPQSLVAEQDQLEAWTAAALGLPNPAAAPARPEEEYYLHVSGQ